MQRRGGAASFLMQLNGAKGFFFPWLWDSAIAVGRRSITQMKFQPRAKRTLPFFALFTNRNEEKKNTLKTSSLKSSNNQKQV